MAARYQIPFYDREGDYHYVNVYDTSYTGSVVTLKGASIPFETAEDDDDDIFTPLRLQSGYLRVIIEDQSDLEGLLPTTALSRPVELIDASGNVEWRGVIKQEMYSGTWGPTPYQIELPVCSHMAAAGDIPFVPTGTRVTIASIVYRIFKTYLGRDFTNVYTPMASSAYTMPELKSYISDGIYYPEEDERIDARWHGEDIYLPGGSSTVKEVLEDICRTFGWQYHEYGPDMVFSHSDVNYRRYSRILFTHLNAISWATIYSYEPGNISLPDIISANHNLDYVSGYNFVQVCGTLEKLSDMLELDFTECAPPSSPKYLGAEDGTKGTSISYFLRDGSSYIIPRQTSVDLLKTQYDENPVAGANVVAMHTMIADRAVWGLDDYENGIMLSYANSNVDAVTIVSRKSFSGYDFVGHGLVFNFSAKGNNEAADFAFDANPIAWAYIKIKWGDLYYQDNSEGGRWTTTALYNSLLIRGDDYSDKCDGYAHNSWEEDQGFVYTPCVKGFKIYFDSSSYIPEGQIEITIRLGASNRKEIFLQDITLEPIGFEQDTLDNPRDNYKVDFRSRLSVNLNDTYVYERKFCTQNPDAPYSRSFIDCPIEYETLILERLAAWYNRMTKQLTVIVKRTEIHPSTKIYYEGNFYAVVAQRKNWYNAESTLTLQQLP